MSHAKASFVWPIAVLLAVIATGYLFFETPRAFTEVPSVTVPTGWYLHRMETGGAILTRQKELPKIGNTERLAYGEQIGFEAVKLDRPIENWIVWRFPDGDPLIILKENSTVNGCRTLKVEQEVEASGKTLSYYLFANGQAYIFTLYPLESPGAVGSGAVRNISGIKTLEQIVSDYAAQL